MRKIKKMLALVIAMVMIVGTMSTAVFADDGDLTVDAKVTVTGLESGDTVTAYQFVTWTPNVGWTLASGLKKLAADGTLSNDDMTIDDITDGLTKDELAALGKQTDKMTAVTGQLAADGKSWEYTCGTVETAGSYLILATANDAQHVYNPAVVSADFSEDSASTVALLTSDTATVKKQNVTLDKEVDNDPDDYSVQVGDIVPFTVTVTVPQYNKNWTEPYFAVSDVLSNGLTLQTVPTVTGLTAGTDYEITDKGTVGSNGFTIKFKESYLKDNASAAVTITYSALVGEAVKDTAQIHEETNKVTLTFSNNPQNSEDHKTIDDETHHYTFAIDASRFGSGSGSTNELIKVGVDSAGNTITTIQEGESWATGVAPLAGAEFTLTGPANSQGEAYSQSATSDENGRIFFNNLEVGTYTLTETKAPAGYIKDNTSHTVEISANFDDDGVLLDYTVTVDGNKTNKGHDAYSATTDADTSSTSDITASADNTKFPIGNTKGVELPSTGGMGTTLFYIIGAVLVLGAGILLVTRRRMSAN